MGNALRVLVWTVVATCACLIVAADICEITDSVAQKKEVLRLANVAQEATLLQARHVARMEETLGIYAMELVQTQEQIQLLEKSLETSVLQVQSLVSDNSKLEAELDSTSAKVKALEDELLRAREALDTAVARVKELEAELDSENNQDVN